MREFATFDDLTRIGREEHASARKFESRIAKSRECDTFLSHSSKDTQLIPGVVTILHNHGATVYVDKLDESLPKTTSRETAEILRTALKDCRRFVLLVTTNSKDSIWIPWELGLADGEKASQNIALFPSASTSYEQSWSEQEYLGLYARIIWGNFANEKPEWLVYDHIKNSAISLGKWIRGY